VLADFDPMLKAWIAERQAAYNSRIMRVITCLSLLLTLSPLRILAQTESNGSGQASERRDFFAAIALETPPSDRKGLSEKLPPLLPALELESSRNNPSTAFPRRKVMKTREEFRAALEELKKKYAPFLEDHTPTATSTRDRLALDDFDFRMEEPEDLKDISRVWRGDGSWKAVRIPDYRGPIGWWAGYYRKVMQIPDGIWQKESVFLRFGGVDYKCQVYLNGRMIGTHEGYFGSFEIDVTPYLRKNGDNVLVVRIENESTMLGLDSWKGPDVDGDKLYADVGPGWDEPGVGWHECPPGAGLWQKVYLEGRPKVNITDIFVRPNLDDKTIEARVEVYQPEKINREVDLKVSVYPRNFRGSGIENIPMKSRPAGPGLTEYRAQIRLGDFRRWELEGPYLYTLRATIQAKNGGPADVRDTQFGMRKFTMDDTSKVKGTLYLNNEPILLRGANTMGHLELAVMRENWDQLMEDILIAKLANMNFFRLTQSPVQPEVYEMCDRLGMLLQTDLPLFGYLRRPKLEEGIRQAGEMERLIRGHPSSIMVSYINEPFSAQRADKSHRFLTRQELEQFFEAASNVVRVYNPDRVIKPVDGDYDPPAPGIPDNHIYSAWYGSHALPIGKFIRGYWVANKDGWKHGSGEYGVEGLEDAETMFRHYPKEWLPASVSDPWNPAKIPFAQTWTMHHSWFDAQDTMKEWIEASQQHQAWGVRTMTRAFRRQSDRIVSTAVHLLIDAWPAGWMKTLVDVDRNPKPAYFEFKEALTPLMVDIRTDRSRYFSGEKLQLEFWVANDRRAEFPRGELLWEVWRAGERIFSQSGPADIPSFSAAFQGYFPYVAPDVKRREHLTVRLGLKSPAGELIHDSELEVEVFPVFDKERNRGREVAIVGKEGGRAWKLAETLGLKPHLFSNDSDGAIAVFVDQVDAYEVTRAEVLNYARKGGNVLFLEQEAGVVWRLERQEVVIKAIGGKEFVSRKTGHPLVAAFQPFDFSYWYDRQKDYIEYVTTTFLDGANLSPVLITGKDAQAGDPYPERKVLPVVGEQRLGKGSLILSELKATARVEYEPVAAAFYQAILDRADHRAGQ